MPYQRYDLTSAQRRLLLDLVAAGDRIAFAEPGEELRTDIETLTGYRYTDTHTTGDHLIVDLRDESWRWMRGELEAGRAPGAGADDTERSAWRHLTWRIAAAATPIETDPEWGHVTVQGRVDMHTLDEPSCVEPAEARVEAGRGAFDHTDGVELTVMIRSEDPAASVYAACELTPTKARELAALLVAGADLIESNPRPVSQHVEYAWHDLFHTPGAELTRTAVLSHDRLTGIDRAEAETALDTLLDQDHQYLPFPEGLTALDFARPAAER